MEGEKRASKMVLRCIAEPIQKKKEKNAPAEDEAMGTVVGREVRTHHNRSTVLGFDTETQVDERQNLLFGSAVHMVNGRLKDAYLFYNDAILTEKQVKILVKYAEEHKMILLTREAFVDTVFYPLVFEAGAVCIGFNLAFDLSRLAIYASYSVSEKGGFSLVLSRNKKYPRLVIKSLDSVRSSFSFIPNTRKMKSSFNTGYFVDARALCFALTGNKYTLKKAVEAFGAGKKLETKRHGIVSPKYIRYNVNDTQITYKLYEKALERYKMFCLDAEPNQLQSPASLGKAYLRKMGVKPFRQKNPDFPTEILGFLMSAYYGGRSECRIRKQPVKVTYLDFASAYPTIYCLYGMDRFLKADKIAYKYTTEESQRFLDRITLDDIRNPNTWPSMVTICRIRPDDDVLPFRTDYAGDGSKNIGINYVKSYGPTPWYTMADLVASKLYTGRAPQILEAITFVPEGVQQGLNDMEVLPGINVKKDEDFVRALISERLKIKKTMKEKTGKEYDELKLKEHVLKIVANTVYGITIQVNANSNKDVPVVVYGLRKFETQADKLEAFGPAFNPVIGVFLTAGVRLILAATETLVKANGGYFAYCDTDSAFVSPEHEGLVKEFFAPLNPYGLPVDMFKVEEDDDHKPLRDVWFYGISAKRYVLYERSATGKITIRKYLSHALGGLTYFEP